jgi:hypothetical protein
MSMAAMAETLEALKTMRNWELEKWIATAINTLSRDEPTITLNPASIAAFVSGWMAKKDAGAKVAGKLEEMKQSLLISDDLRLTQKGHELLPPPPVAGLFLSSTLLTDDLVQDDFPVGWVGPSHPDDFTYVDRFETQIHRVHRVDHDRTYIRQCHRLADGRHIGFTVLADSGCGSAYAFDQETLEMLMTKVLGAGGQFQQNDAHEHCLEVNGGLHRIRLQTQLRCSFMGLTFLRTILRIEPGTIGLSS